MNEDEINYINKILMDSISNVVCIDESYIEPYSLTEMKPDDLSIKVYTAFSDEMNCQTLMVQYKDGDDSWKRKLDKKDLLVVDWQLTSPADPSKPLEIIDSALENHIQYICIYTSSDGDDLREIQNRVLAYYSGYTKEEIEKNASAAIGRGMSEYDIKEHITGLISSAEEAKAYKNEMKKIPGVELSKDTKAEFDHCDYNSWNKLYIKYICKMEKLSRHVLSSSFSDKGPIIVDSSYIFFVTKGKKKEEINPSVILSTILDELSSSPRCLYDILWIYYFNLIKESIYKSKKISQRMSADAMKYYACSDIGWNESEDYFSTIRGLVLDEIIEYINGDSRAIPEAWIAEKIKNEGNTIRFETVSTELMKLNAYMNVNSEISQHIHDMTLGDVFCTEVQEGDQKKLRYCMCISALCDCNQVKTLSKIEGGMASYSFVFSNKEETTFGRINPEEALISYIWENRDEVVRVEWDNHIFGGYAVTGQKINPKESIKVFFENKEYSLQYICNIKEKYAQRIVNDAFSWGHRVGTSFAKKRKNEQ